MVALSLNWLAMGTTELISVGIDSEKTPLDLKKAVKAKAPALITGSATFLRFYLAKSAPGTSGWEARWPD